MEKGKQNIFITFINLTKEFLIDSFKKVESLEGGKNLKKRIIVSVIALPIAIYAIFFSKSLFLFLLILVAILMSFEWKDLTSSAVKRTKWNLIGLAYISIPLYCTAKISFISSNVLFWMFCVIWATDIFAFFVGKRFGGPKLIPSISPNKTWAGLAGGIIASMIIGSISAIALFNSNIIFFAFLSAFLSAIEQMSDIMESKFKRIFGAKDSGNILPGHGGILDRFDGLMLVAPVTLFFITVFSEYFSL